MSRRSSSLLFFYLLFALADCGKKGPIETPVMRIPQAVEDLAVSQRGSACLLTWTAPSAYIDGSPLGEISELEIWLTREDRAEEGTLKTWSAAAFGEKAQLLESITGDTLASLRREGAKTEAELIYRYPIAAEDIGKKTLTFSLRVRDGKKRTSEFADPVSLEARTPLGPPRNVRAEVFEDHIRLSWEGQVQPKEEPALVMMPLVIPMISSPIDVPVAPATAPSTTPAPAAGFNVFRSEEGNAAARVNASPLETSEFPDKDFQFGRTYRYFVRAVVESKPLQESDDSEVVEVAAKDAFPPAPPSGLTTIGGPDFIALSWEGNREPDLAGYRVWRKPAGEGEFTLAASLTAVESSFSDKEVEKSRRYEYAITALDVTGNESPKSAAAIGSVREMPWP
ncbi:MAG: Fibronectin, type domain protein [Candidatus Aminicenantes bacterium]|nr:Fibronectin, type domain protein [Candidatus Aminicenantes bacterium]